MKDEVVKKWIIRLFKPYIKNIIMMILCTIIVVFCGFIIPFLTKNLVDESILNRDMSSLIKNLLMFTLIYSVQYLSEFIQFIFYKPLCAELPNELNRLAWTHVLNIKLKYFKEKNFSEILAENMQDISNIVSLIDIQFLTSIINLMKMISGFIALLYISPKLMLLLAVVAPLKLFLNTKFYNKKIKINKEILIEQTKFSKWIGDCVSGIYEIKMWDLIDKKEGELKGILSIFKKIRYTLMNYGYIEALLGALLMLVANLGIYFLGALFTFRNEMTIGGLLAFITYAAFIFEPLEIISGILNKLSIVTPSLHRFDRFMETDVEYEKDNAITLSGISSVDSIEFKNVSFSYGKDESEKIVLNKIDFNIKKGEVIGIAGKNGCGKSTIVDLITRFYDSNEGTICINSIDIRDIKLKDYRRLFGIMSQKSYIFNDTIANNINITGELTKEDIKYFSDISGLENSIKNMKDKYDYVVGFDGQKMSGGQRQKLSMARTLSKSEAKVLILDEATSNYDIQSAHEVIDKIIKNKNFDIVIIISHQPEILEKLNRILFLKNGEIVSEGSYKELIRKNADFNEMVENAYMR